MRAIYAEEPNKIGYRDIEVPEIKDDEVLIKTAYAGICASDLHAYKGRHAFRIPPVMLGHEISGVVEKVGKNVKTRKVGDHVTVMPQIGCGKCPACKAGKSNLCTSKILPGTPKWNGTFADYFAAPESVTFDLKDVPLDLGSITEPLAVATHAIGRVPEGHNGDLIILGSGAIALMILAIAPSYGFTRIMTTDIDDRNLALAKELGAAVTVNVAREDAAAKSREFFGNDGGQNLIIGAGSTNILEQAIDIVGTGGNIVYYAMITKEMTLNTYPMVFKELDIRGSLNYTGEDFDKAIELLSHRGDLFRKIVTRCFEFDEAAEAFELQDTRKEFIVKSILKVNG